MKTKARDLNDILREEGDDAVRRYSDGAKPFRPDKPQAGGKMGANGSKRDDTVAGSERDAEQLPTPFTAEALDKMRFDPIKFVVPGYIVEGLTLFAGKPKIGKSWLLLHAAIAVARGGFTLGDVHCPEGDALYCALEDNKRRLQSRMTKLLQTPPVAAPAVLYLRNATADGGRAGLHQEMDRWRQAAPARHHRYPRHGPHAKPQGSVDL